MKQKVKILNVATIKQRKYDTLDLDAFYNNLLGQIESRCWIFLYGTSGSGKSVFAMQFANHFAKKVGKSLYNSHEEAMKQTIRDRLVNFNIDATRLFVGEQISFEDIIEKIRSNYYRMVIFDSVQYARFTYDQLQKLDAAFKKRKIVFVLVSFGKQYKNPACSVDIMHACDVKIFFDKGVATVDSRYKGETVKARIFTPNKQGVVERTLFE